MPTTKDFLVKVKDLPEFDGLKLTPDNKLRIPDATINLGETAGGVATNTLNKDHFNLGSGTTTMLIEPNTFRMIKDIPADVEQQTDAEYYKVEIDSVHQTFTIYDTDRITPIFQVTSSGLALGSSVITGITSQGGTSSTLAASQLLVNGKQNTLTAGSNIQIVNDVISAVLTEATNIIGTTDPQVGQGSPGVLYLKYEDVPSGSHVDPETGETVTDYTRDIANVYGNISGLWYEFPDGRNLFGTTAPTSSMGKNGSIYIQYDTTDGIVHVYGKVNDTWYEFPDELNLFGTTAPTSNLGENGSIYMQYDTTNGITQIYGKVNDTWYEFPDELNLFGTTPPTADMGDNGSIYMQFNTVDGIVHIFGKINDTWYEFPDGRNLFGTTSPTSDLGDNGSIYMQYNTTEGITQVFGKVNNTWYPFGGSGNTNYMELTKAQYNALSPAEKNNGTIYFITDGISSLAGAEAMVLYGTDAPAANIGSNGTLYIQYLDDNVTAMYCKINGAWLQIQTGGGGAAAQEYIGTFSSLNPIYSSNEIQVTNITYEEVT